MRFTQNPLARLAVKVTNRQRLIFAGFCLAVGLLVGGVTFLLINFGNNKDSFAALGNNMGFENGTTEWANISGTWSSNTNATYVRTGTKSLKVTQSNGTDGEVKNTSATVTVPSSGTNYMVVMAYAKASDNNAKMKLGVINTSSGTETLATTYTNLTSSGFTRIKAVISVTNGATYSPVVAAKRSGGGSTSDVYVDDVHMYTTTMTTADTIAPAAPTAVSATTSGSTITLNWTNGTDTESGIDGLTILRYTGILTTDQTLNNQAVYHTTTSTIGPTTAGSWSVIYQGSSITSFADNPGATGTYTYLLYMRDKASNYTTSSVTARIIAVNAASGTTINLTSNASVDGLYVGSGNIFTINSGATLLFRSSAAATIYGTLIHQGAITNGSSNAINVKSGGLYQYDRDGNSGYPVMAATWETGATCEIKGVKNYTPSGMSQTYYNLLWNSNQQVAAQDLPSGIVINGDLTFQDGGVGSTTRVVWLNGLLTVKGNFTVGTSGEFKCRTGSYVKFNGSAMQTIQVTGSTCRFNAFEIDNSSGVKQMNDVLLDSLCRLTSGSLDLSSYTFKHENSATIVKGLGTTTNGNFTPVTGSYVYNLVYERGNTTDIELTSSTSYLNNLTISTPTGETVTLDKTANVNGTLTMNTGKIQTGNYEVYVKNSAANAVVVNGSTSYVYGDLRRNILNTGSLTYEFPVGSSTNPQYATLVLNNLSTISNILGNFSSTITGSAPNCWINSTNVNTLLNCGIWTMTPDAQPTGGTYDITVKGKGYTNPPASGDRCGVIKRDNSSGVWKSIGTHVNNTQSMSGGVVTAKRSALTSFSDFGIAYGNAVLPITLSMFNATLQSGKVNIVWTTSAELNNAYFSLERSTNGVDFEMINEQNGQGTSTTQHNYSYIDEHPTHGHNYYRLKQIDFDGNFTYSPIRQVNIAGATVNSSSSEISIYPNPGSGFFNFSHLITSGVEDHATIKIVDVKGQLILQKNFSGNDLVKIDLTSQPPGIYMATITDANNQTISKQLVIQR